MVTILGWVKRLAARASRWKRRTTSADVTISGRMSLSAMALPSMTWVARYTAPMAPLTEEALDPVFTGQGPSAEPFLGRQLVLEDAAVVGAEPLAHHELPATGGAGAHLAWDYRIQLR